MRRRKADASYGLRVDATYDLKDATFVTVNA